MNERVIIDQSQMSIHPALVQTRISLFKGVTVKNEEKPIKVFTLSEYFQYQQSDEVRQLTTKARKLKQEEGEKAYKSKRKEFLPSICMGIWETRGKLIKRSNLLIFDIDGGDEGAYIFNLESAKKSPYIYRVEQSLGGGTRIYVIASFEEEFRKKVCLRISEHLSDILEIPLKKDANASEEHIDTGAFDIKRMWFVAYTLPNLIYQNNDSKIFEFHHPPSVLVKKGKDNERGAGQYAFKFSEEDKALDIIRQISESGVDITVGRNDVWFPKILLPIANLFGEKGRDYAHQVSRFHENYSEAETNREYNEALKKDTARVTIGSFLAYAKQQGFSYDIKRLLNKYSEKEKVSEKKTLSIIPATSFEENEIPEPTIDESGFCIEDGRYKFKVNKAYVTASNFTITPLYLLRDSRDPKRIIKLDNCFGDHTTLCIPVKAFSRSNEFAAIVEGRGNYVLSWNTHQFSVLKEHLYQYEEVAEEISVLGYQVQTGYYAFSNGIFDGECFHEANEYGIVVIKDEHYYLPAFSIVNEDAAQEYHNERKFVFKPGKTNFSNWSKLLLQVFGDNAIAGICFLVAASFRDIVYNHVNCFPMLFLFGPKGTGKTTYRNALHRLFGNYGPNDAIGLGSSSSPKGFSRKLAQNRNALQPFEEYKNKIDPRIIEMLKNVYDGIGYERAQTTNDNRTHATLVNSAVILGGQEMPSKENALFSRVIMLTFSKTRFSDNERNAFGELEQMIIDGLGNVLLEILQHREIFKNEFAQSFSKVHKQLRTHGTTKNMEERIISNVAALVAPFLILSRLLDFPFDYQTAFKFITTTIESQHRQMVKSNEVNQFWDILDILEGQYFIKGNHYGISDGVLSIYIKCIYPLYNEHATKQKLNVLDENSLKSYLSMQPYFIHQKDGRKDKPVRLSGGPGIKPIRCMQFKLEGMRGLELNFLN